MYVLARRVNEEVEIAGGLIRVRVLSITGSIVRLGFEAPDEVDIKRSEMTEDERSDTD